MSVAYPYFLMAKYVLIRTCSRSEDRVAIFIYCFATIRTSLNEICTMESFYYRLYTKAKNTINWLVTLIDDVKSDENYTINCENQCNIMTF